MSDVDLSDIYLKRKSVSKYFLFFHMKLLVLQVFICKCWQDQTPDIKTWYRLVMTGFNRMPQLYVKSCVWYSAAVDVIIPHVSFTEIQQPMFKSILAVVIAHSTALRWETTDFIAFHKGHFMDGKLKHTEKVIYPGESWRCRITHNQMQSSWLPV